MTRFLVSDDNPEGYKLEDILILIRKDILNRSGKIADDRRPEALHVMANNMKVLNLLSDAISLAENSTQTLDRAFGPQGTEPRIGNT